MIDLKDLFTCMNKSVGCKTMENIKNCMQLHLITETDKGINRFSQLNVKNIKFCDGLRMIESQDMDPPTWKLEVHATVSHAAWGNLNSFAASVWSRRGRGRGLAACLHQATCGVTAGLSSPRGRLCTIEKV